MKFEGAFAIIKKRGEEKLRIFQGEITNYSKLKQIPRGKTLNMIPFSQIHEKGYVSHKGNEKIISMKIKSIVEADELSVCDDILDNDIGLEGDVKYKYSQKQYEKIVKDIVEKEIGNGEGCNFVIAQKVTGKINEFDQLCALNIFKKLLQSDYGSYMTFIYFDGKKYFIGATPERHITMDGKSVRMNPISGTYRKLKTELKLGQFKQDLIPFLNNQKEINELFMVVDEELKMMAKICDIGGMIVGPLLKEMSKLIHTEYLLNGKSHQKRYEVFANSMRAPTLTGSPLENACNIIKKYETESRGYYGGAMVFIDDSQDFYLDSCIIIRTFQILNNGNFEGMVGASIVRDSVPTQEYKETIAKISAVLNIIKGGQSMAPNPYLTKLIGDDVINEKLQLRNQDLSTFRFFNQYGHKDKDKKLEGKKVLIIENEDEFTNMMGHMLNHYGVKSQIVNYNDNDIYKLIDSSDFTIVGPGPGNPNDIQKQKIKQNLEIIDYLYKNNCKFAGICLGHQLISKFLDLDVVKSKNPTQGVQRLINFFGEKEIVGLYNTFVAKVNSKNKLLNELAVSYDEDSKDIYALRGRNFFSLQFHPESILSKNGYGILKFEIMRFLNNNH